MIGPSCLSRREEKLGPRKQIGTSSKKNCAVKDQRPRTAETWFKDSRILCGRGSPTEWRLRTTKKNVEQVLE